MQLWELRRENLPLTREINLFARLIQSNLCSVVTPLGMAYWLLITGWLFNTNLWSKQTRRAELKERPKDTGLTNVRVIQENEASQKAEYLSHDKLTLICFYFFLGQKKKVKNHLTPYTVWPVALVWYVFYSSQSEVKTIKNNSLAPRKRWPRPLRPA